MGRGSLKLTPVHLSVTLFYVQMGCNTLTLTDGEPRDANAWLRMEKTGTCKCKSYVQIGEICLAVTRKNFYMTEPSWNTATTLRWLRQTIGR